jgi:predicted phosphoribosyltransferase
MFANREHAAQQLAERLETVVGDRPLVLAIPRGGVPMGKVIAEALGGELDAVLVHKLGAPGNPELAVGAVSEQGDVLVRETARALGVDQDYIDREAKTQLKQLRARRRMYTPDRGPISPAGRTVIVVDDGVATGSTMEAALRAVRKASPATLIVATAVAPADTVATLREWADEVVCLETPARFVAVGQVFVEFEPVADEEVTAALRSGPGPHSELD